MTEMNPTGSVARKQILRSDLNKSNEELIQNQAYAGIVLNGLEAKIVHPDNYNQILSNDGKTIGELLVKGPWITTRYYNENYHQNFHNDWLITGDVAMITSNNQIIICDRSKDLIKSGGEWISSVDLENCIMGMKQIKSACVIGISHPVWDERPIVVVELRDGFAITLQEVRQHCQEKGFAKFQLPDDVVIVKAIPLTGTGKFSKKTLREELKNKNYVLPQHDK